MGVTNGPGSEPLSAQTPRTLDSVTSAWLPAPPKQSPDILASSQAPPPPPLLLLPSCGKSLFWVLWPELSLGAGPIVSHILMDLSVAPQSLTFLQWLF